MDRLLEFVGNHLLLNLGLIVVVIMIIRMELDRLIGGVVQINPFEAIRQVNDQNAVVVDVREGSEYSNGHLKDAIHIPMSEFGKRLNELEKYKSKALIAYCRSGSRSYSACKKLKKAGFESVSNLQGGIMAWENQNMPITKK